MSKSDQNLFSLAQIQHLMRVEFNRAQRYKYPIACLMISVDRLGHLRDLYGYEAKEEIMDAVIGMLQTETRSSDFLGRMADDRLLCVVPHTHADGTECMATRLIDLVEGLDFESDGRAIRITLSIGASCSDGETTMFFDSLLQAADRCLGQVSEQGGNRFLAEAPGAVQP